MEAYMRRSSVYTSAAFHAIILLIALMGLPLLTHHDFVIPQPITVDLVEISKVTQTDRVAPQPTPPKPRPPEPPKPAPAPVNTSPQPVPVQEPPKPQERVVKPAAEQVDENALPKKVTKVIKKEEPKPQTPNQFAQSILKNLGPAPKNQPTPPPGQNTPLGEKLTMSEMDALRSQLEQCWDVPIGAKNAENMAVDIFMVINPDRTLREAHVVDTSRYNSDTFFQSAADSAMRAVRNCSPFNVPADKYDTWKTVTVTFNPKDMI
jgi:outer membrane biosynthesis protein TonB